MVRRFQFSLRALLVVILAVACFVGGIQFERERRRREDEAATFAAAARGAPPFAPPTSPPPFAFPTNGPLILRSVKIKRQATLPRLSDDSTRVGSPRIEALELRGFEGMMPRPVE